MIRQWGSCDITPSVPFLNLDLITWLMVQSNITPIINDRQKVTALVDSGVQVPSVSSGVFEQIALRVHPLDRLLKLEITGVSAFPYLGYVEVSLQICSVRGYNKDVMLLVIPATTYAKKILVMVGSKIIDRAMGMIMKWEQTRATTAWKQAHFDVVVLGSLQLPHECTKGWESCRR